MEKTNKFNLLFILATLCLLIYNYLPIITLKILFFNDSYFYPKETPFMVPILLGTAAVSIIAMATKELKTKRLMANILIALVLFAIIGTAAFIYFITYYSIHEEAFKIIPSFGIIFGFMALIIGISLRKSINKELNPILNPPKFS